MSFLPAIRDQLHALALSAQSFDSALAALEETEAAGEFKANPVWAAQLVVELNGTAAHVATLGRDFLVQIRAVIEAAQQAHAEPPTPTAEHNSSTDKPDTNYKQRFSEN